MVRYVLAELEPMRRHSVLRLPSTLHANFADATHVVAQRRLNSRISAAEGRASGDLLQPKLRHGDIEQPQRFRAETIRFLHERHGDAPLGGGSTRISQSSWPEASVDDLITMNPSSASVDKFFSELGFQLKSARIMDAIGQHAEPV
jgi:hypothetical protein